MGAKVNWAGVRQGKLTILRNAGKDKHGSRLWLCVCDCGKEVTKTSNVLKAGQQSCGVTCGVADSNRARTVHGQASRDRGTTKEYRVWTSMNARCSNPKYPAWHRYGGRGITVCPEWAESFEAFYAHVGDAPTAKHTLDRIDNDRGYEPGNVRWATRKEQANNRDTNTWIEYDGKCMTWAQWAEYLGIPYNTLMTRVKKRQPLSRILQPRLNAERNELVEVDGRKQTLREWEKETGISYQTLYIRKRLGQDLLAPVRKHVIRR